MNIPAGYLNTSAVFIDILYGKGGEKDTQIRTNYDIMKVKELYRIIQMGVHELDNCE